MKTEEALEVLKGNFLRITLEERQSHADVFAEAFEMAIKVLEKQIPKKPLDEEEYKWFTCPTCGRVLVRYHQGEPHHCECGQKIDWSEEE